MIVLTKRQVMAWVVLASVIVVAGPAKLAHAVISNVNMFRSILYSQTGDGPSLAPVGAFLNLDLVSTDPDEYDTVEVSFLGPASPVTLTQVDPTTYTFGSSLYPSQASMDGDFPMAIYTFEATNTSGTDTTEFDYAADAYPLTEPYLTGTNYSDLQGMDPSVPFSFEFSSYVPSPGPPNFSFIFFRIYETPSFTLAFDAPFLPPTTTGLVMPGGTLMPSTSYFYELIFSDRVLVPSPGALFDALISFDLRTQGGFATVPEPSTIVLVCIGLGAGAGLVGDETVKFPREPSWESTMLDHRALGTQPPRARSITAMPLHRAIQI